MCLSPDEMSTAQIEAIVVVYRRALETGLSLGRPVTQHERTAIAFRLDQFEQLLKERAEAGTY